nr:MAG TPA: hypothetical protein [Caudoviricetes sp.]
MIFLQKIMISYLINHLYGLMMTNIYTCIQILKQKV